jgi:hypothetical protein
MNVGFKVLPEGLNQSSACWRGSPAQHRHPPPHQSHQLYQFNHQKRKGFSMTLNSDQAAPELSPELAQIAADAAAIDPPQVAPGTEAAAPSEPVDYYTDAKGLTDIAAESLAAFYPRTEAVLSPDRREKFAAALAPVMEKYGLSLGVIFGRWGAEINLAFVTAQFAVPLARAIADDRAAARAEKTGQAEPVQPIEKVGLRPVVDRADPTALHNRV